LSLTIAIHSYRGGTGKSSITASLATLLAAEGRAVGVVDTDIHSPGIHVIFGLPEERMTLALNDYLWGRCPLRDAAYDVSPPMPDQSGERPVPGRVFLIPSSVRAGEIARVLREGYDVGKLTDGFRGVVEELRLDFLLIDTHPGVNEETLLSVAISDLLLLVLRPDRQDFQGTAVTVELARRLGVPATRVVVNKVPAGMDWEQIRAQVESAYESPVVAMLPLSEEVAQLASTGVFAVRHPAHAFTAGLRQVARDLLAGVRGGPGDGR
jgi:MinD-like ATPase involved in chromosome partitioning or flagellar assembly